MYSNILLDFRRENHIHIIIASIVAESIQVHKVEKDVESLKVSTSGILESKGNSMVQYLCTSI